MRSQFEPKLDVNTGSPEEGGGDVAVKGTFDWDDGEQRAAVSACIQQPGERVGMAQTKEPVANTSDPQKWELKVSSISGSKPLTPGPAVASGVVCALGSGIQMRQFSWRQDITLV